MGNRAVLNSVSGGGMAIQPNGNQRVQFGVFEVDMKAGELRRGGTRIRLQEQPFQILAMLLERHGEVVTREELRGRLWPADTYVDFDHSLNAAVRRLRDALGDSAENSRFVETVARRGYRLLVPVNRALPPASATPAFRATSSAVKWRIIAVAAVLLVGVAVGWVAARWRNHPVQIRQRRLTANPEENPVLGAEISPNGKYLAFSDNTGFYLRETDTGETHPLSLPPGFTAVPAGWYPDGTHLLATWVEGPKASSGLWQVSIVGGEPRKLIDDVRLASVSPDGSQVAVVRGPNLNEEIWLMQANGERPRQLVPGQRCMFGKPAWSPDGQRIAFAFGNYEPERFEVKSSIGMVDVESAHQETIFAESSSQAVIKSGIDLSSRLGPGVVWTADNQLIYSISEPPPNQNDFNIWSVALDSHGHIAGTPVRLTATPDEVANLSATADGKHIAYTKYSLNPDVYVAELNPAGTRMNTPQRLTLDDRKDYPFAWTPDSKTVFFASDRDGIFHIFKQRIDQTVPELMVGGSEQTTAPRLTPDGSAIIYVIWPKVGDLHTPSRLMRLALGGGPPQTLLEHNGIGNLQCARLPSTLCLYDERTPAQLSFFRFDPATGKNEELPLLKVRDNPAYAYNWSLSPDGKILAIGKREGVQKDPSITLVSLEGGSTRTITAQAWAGISSIDFATDGRSLWAPVFTNTRKWALLNIDLQGRTTTVLEDADMIIGWAIPAPDGRHLAFWKARSSSNVWMVEGF
jgi:DNA-binding winged helix-turn-helix (wHTH) protein/Tol biopolymer transport system component